jgi:ankyrin repeat protein
MKTSILLSLLLLPLIALANNSEMDRCSITGENAAWLIVRDNPLHVTETKLVQGKIQLPEDVLSNAVQFGYTDLVKKLLEDKKLVKLHGGDALSIAASMGRIGMSRLLIQHGIPPNAKNDMGTTALYPAVQYGCTDEVLFLVKHGVDINFRIGQGRITPMLEAVTDRHFQTAAILLQNGYKLTPWELKKIKWILSKQFNGFVWDYLFAKLDAKLNPCAKEAKSSIKSH